MNDMMVIAVSLMVVGIPLGIQGYCVRREKWGYRKDPRVKDHPEMKGVRKGDKMLYVSFSSECWDPGKDG